jgi:hypothetical protein
MKPWGIVKSIDLRITLVNNNNNNNNVWLHVSKIKVYTSLLDFVFCA